MISKDLLSELQIILREEFGMNMTHEQVFMIGTGLVNYFELLSKYKYENEESKKNNITQKN